MWAVPGFIEVELLVEARCPQEREKDHSPAQERLALLDDRGRRKMPLHLFVHEHRYTDLFQVVHLQDAAGRFARFDDELPGRATTDGPAVSRISGRLTSSIAWLPEFVALAPAES